MQRAVSSYLFVNHRLTPGLLERLAKGGAEGVEVFGARQHFDYTDRVQVRELASWFAQNQIRPHSLHSPLYSDYEWGRSGAPSVNVVTNEKRLRIESMDEIKRALESAEQIPFRYLIQHIGEQNESLTPEKFDYMLTAVEHIRAFAKPLGVTLLVENIPNEISQPGQIKEVLRVGHFKDVGVCFDFGHAHMGDGVRVDFETVQDHILSTHIHDNKQDRDTHLWPGDGTIDWQMAMQLIREAPQKPPILLEVNGDNETMDSAISKLAKSFSLLESHATARQA